MSQEPNWKAMMDDVEYRTVALAWFKVYEDSVDLKFDDGWSFGYDRNLAPDFIPKVGMKVTQWGKGIGYPVHGLKIDDRLIYYRTREQEEERHRQWCEDKDKKDKADYAANRQSNDDRIQKLPAEFQRRIYSFQIARPDWGPKFEGYELFVCEQAVAIADELKNAEAIRELSYCFLFED